MFNNIKIFAANNLWKSILSELGADIINIADFADLNFDLLNIETPISIQKLNEIIINEIDNNQKRIMQKVFNKIKILPKLQLQIIVLLYQSEKLSAKELKSILGFAPDTSSHTIDTAIYQLRRAYGADFVKNENGKYFLGKL